jgi:hypothetical protein
MVLTVLLGCGGALAQTPPEPGRGPGRGPAPDPLDVAATLPIGSGPYRAIMEADPGLPTHTVYRPADLSPLASTKIPIVAWANGACANVGNRFRWFLSDIASYGYLIVAIGPIGPNSAATLGVTPLIPQPSVVGGPGAAAPPAGLPPPESHSSQLIDAINWVVAENDRSGGKYYHRLDTKKIAVMGQSCGGVQAIEASADPRVATSIIWNSGLFPAPSTMGGGKAMSKDDLKRLHAPTAYISGDEEDIAFPNANDDFDKISGIPLFRGYERGVLHTATYRERNGGEYSGVGVAWLNWQLKGDRQAALMFTGTNCGLCVNPKWVVRKKGMN